MFRHLPRLIAITFAISVFCVTPRSRATAQTDQELAQARGWFAEGIEHSEAGRYEDAVASFRRVLAVKGSPPVRYNLALNLYELGLVREADENVQMLLEDPETTPDIRSSAADLRLHMEETGGRLQVEVSGATPGTYDVQLDGRRMLAGDLGRSLRVRAGDHVVVVMRGDEELGTQVFHVVAGEASVGQVEVAPSAREVAEESELEEDEAIVIDEEEEERPLARKWQFWAVVGSAADGRH